MIQSANPGSSGSISPFSLRSLNLIPQIPVGHVIETASRKLPPFAGPAPPFDEIELNRSSINPVVGTVNDSV